MEYRSLGRTGIRVSSISLGVMNFGAWGSTGKTECAAILNRAIDAGVNLVDSADFYAAGESESILGSVLKRRRDEVLISTKAFRPMGGSPNMRGGSRRWILQACDDSLRRLGTDYIDIYQLHRRDEACDLEESIGALTDLVRRGKVRSIGCSTFPASYIVEAQWIAERRAMERLRVNQPPYSILARDIEADVLPTCSRYGMGVLTWSPLNGGWLSGKWYEGAPDPSSQRAERIPVRYDPAHTSNAEKLRVCSRLRELAAEAGLTLVELSVAWVLRHQAVSSTIVGPRTVEHLDGYLSACGVSLDDDLLDAIDELVEPGSNMQMIDTGYRNPGLVPAFRRGHQPLWSFPDGVPR